MIYLYRQVVQGELGELEHMVKLDENTLNDWVYKIISLLNEPDKAKMELINLSSYITHAPRAEKDSMFPKTSIR
jgi:hypothetical protein